MKHFLSAAAALTLFAALLAGCRGNVSNDKNGKITEPTMMPETIATMPSTDTLPPMTTEPAPTTQATRPTEQESTVDPTPATTGPATKARPNRSMG